MVNHEVIKAIEDLKKQFRRIDNLWHDVILYGTEQEREDTEKLLNINFPFHLALEDITEEVQKWMIPEAEERQ